MELFESIRREYEFGEGTIAGVARKLGVHRRVVRDAIRNALPMARKKPDRPHWKLKPFIPMIESMLEADREAPRKQRHTAHRIWQRIKQEVPGCETQREVDSQVCPQAQIGPGLDRTRDLCAPELSLGIGSAGGLVRSLRRPWRRTHPPAGFRDAEHGWRRLISSSLPTGNTAGISRRSRTGIPPFWRSLQTPQIR